MTDNLRAMGRTHAQAGAVLLVSAALIRWLPVFAFFAAWTAAWFCLSASLTFYLFSRGAK